jgi:hypothetical protein
VITRILGSFTAILGGGEGSYCTWRLTAWQSESSSATLVQQDVGSKLYFCEEIPRNEKISRVCRKGLPLWEMTIVARPRTVGCICLYAHGVGHPPYFCGAGIPWTAVRWPGRSRTQNAPPGKKKITVVPHRQQRRQGFRNNSV